MTWPNHKARGQSVVEYGLILASVIVVAMLGFNSLSAAETRYFQGFEQQVAPTPNTAGIVPFATFTPTPSPTPCAGPCPTSTPLGPTPIPALTISINDQAAAEGNVVFFTVALSKSGSKVDVDYSMGIPAATAGGGTSCGSAIDYTSSKLSDTLTFQTNQTTKTISVTLCDDSEDEDTENFAITLSNAKIGGSAAPSSTIADGQGLGTIYDNDGPTVQFASPTFSASESVTAVDLPVQISAGSIQSVTVSYSVTGGTATGNGTDYTLAAGTLTFAAASGTPGPITQNISFTLNNDSLDEADETIQVTLANPVNATLGTNRIATYTIVDDDPPPLITFSIDKNVISEDGSAPEGNQATLTATLSGQSGKNIQVGMTFAGSTAVAADYTLSPATFSIPAGSTTASVTFTAVQDTMDEADTETLNVSLSVAISDCTAPCTSAFTISINDDDLPPTVSINSPSVTEGNNKTNPITFTVSLSSASSFQIDMNYATAPGTAIGGTLGGGGNCSGAGADYVNVGSTSLPFAPGDTSKLITILVCADAADEPDETFTVTLSGATNVSPGGQMTGTATIIDDPADVPVVSAADRTANEGNSGTSSFNFAVTLSPVSWQTVTVNYATADGATNPATGGASCGSGVDYITTGGSLSFAPGEASKTVTVLVCGDVLHEANETFKLNLSSPTNATLGTNGTGTITNDDAAPSVTLDPLSPTIIAEDGGSTTVTARLNAASGLTVTVNLLFAPTSTAAYPADYARSGSSITIPAGSITGSISLTAAQDTLDEADETIVVEIGTVTNGTEAGAQQVTATITDDDPEPSLSIGDVTAVEGASGGTTNASFTISLTPVSGRSVSVSYATANGATNAAVGGGSCGSGGVDYITTGGSLSFAAGETSKPVIVPVCGDGLDEVNETFFVNLSAPVNATLSDMQGLATITDDDTAGISVADVSIVEGTGGTTPAVFTVSLSTASSQPVTVDYATADNFATTVMGDYTAAGGILTFAPGQTAATVTVLVNGDNLDELDETFFLNLSNPNPPSAVVTDGQGLGTIVDDDAPPTLSINSVSVLEGTGATTDAVFTVTLSQVSSLAVAVDYATASGTARGGACSTPGDDFVATSGTLTFAPGESGGKTLSVAVCGDGVYEETETFTVPLSNQSNATLSPGNQTGTGTIQDDEVPPTVTLDPLNPATIDEAGGIAILIARLSVASSQDVTVNLALSGSASGSDYAASATVTIPAGSTSNSITLTAVQDALDESAETIIVDIDTVINGTESGTQQVTATIVDDDPEPSLSIAGVNVVEGAAVATTNTNFTVSLSAVSGQNVTVNYAAGAGSAVSGDCTVGGDYAPATGTLVIPAGAPSGTIVVTICGDDLFEGDESFTVSLSSPTNASIAVGTATGTITDDDPVP